MTFTTATFPRILKADYYLADIDDTAVGDDSVFINQEKMRSVEHYLFPYSRKWSNPYARFHTLRKHWQLDTAVKSSISEIVMHPAYQQIIGMGPTAVPFILTEMQLSSDHWFWALRSISGDDPVESQHRGNIKKMTEAWLQWGRNQGYIR